MPLLLVDYRVAEGGGFERPAHNAIAQEGPRKLHLLMIISQFVMLWTTIFVCLPLALQYKCVLSVCKCDLSTIAPSTMGIYHCRVRGTNLVMCSIS